MGQPGARRRELELPVSEHKLAARAAMSPLVKPAAERGYHRLFLQSVLQADRGVDFDFLVPVAMTGRVPRFDRYRSGG